LRDASPADLAEPGQLGVVANRAAGPQLPDHQEQEDRAPRNLHEMLADLACHAQCSWFSNFLLNAFVSLVNRS
jgi:hypothetical protein